MENRTCGHLLLLREDSTVGKSFPLDVGSFTIGTTDNATIRLKNMHANIEEIHCTVDVQKNGSAVLTNNPSLQSVKLNGEIILKHKNLKHGDVFTIMTKTIKYDNENMPPYTSQQTTPMKTPRSYPGRKTPVRARHSMGSCSVKKRSMTPDPKKKTPVRARKKRSNSFASANEFDVIYEEPGAPVFKTPESRRQSVRIKMANGSFDKMDITSEILPSVASTPHVTRGFLVSTPTSAMKPTLRKGIDKQSSDISSLQLDFKEDSLGSDDEISSITARDIRTPVTEVVPLTETITPSNNTSVVLIESPIEEGILSRSQKSLAKIQNLSVINLDSSNETPKCKKMSASMHQASSSALKKTLLLEDFDKSTICALDGTDSKFTESQMSDYTVESLHDFSEMATESTPLRPNHKNSFNTYIGGNPFKSAKKKEAEQQSLPQLTDHNSKLSPLKSARMIKTSLIDDKEAFDSQKVVIQYLPQVDESKIQAKISDIPKLNESGADMLYESQSAEYYEETGPMGIAEIVIDDEEDSLLNPDGDESVEPLDVDEDTLLQSPEVDENCSEYQHLQASCKQLGDVEDLVCSETKTYILKESFEEVVESSEDENLEEQSSDQKLSVEENTDTNSVDCNVVVESADPKEYEDRNMQEENFKIEHVEHFVKNDECSNEVLDSSLEKVVENLEGSLTSENESTKDALESNFKGIEGNDEASFLECLEILTTPPKKSLSKCIPDVIEATPTTGQMDDESGKLLQVKGDSLINDSFEIAETEITPEKSVEMKTRKSRSFKINLKNKSAIEELSEINVSERTPRKSLRNLKIDPSETIVTEETTPTRKSGGTVESTVQKSIDIIKCHESIPKHKSTEVDEIKSALDSSQNTDSQNSTMSESIVAEDTSNKSDIGETETSPIISEDDSITAKSAIEDKTEGTPRKSSLFSRKEEANSLFEQDILGDPGDELTSESAEVTNLQTESTVVGASFRKSIRKSMKAESEELMNVENDSLIDNERKTKVTRKSLRITQDETQLDKYANPTKSKTSVIRRSRREPSSGLFNEESDEVIEKTDTRKSKKVEDFNEDALVEPKNSRRRSLKVKDANLDDGHGDEVIKSSRKSGRKLKKVGNTSLEDEVDKTTSAKIGIKTFIQSDTDRSMKKSAKMSREKQEPTPTNSRKSERTVIINKKYYNSYNLSTPISPRNSSVPTPISSSNGAKHRLSFSHEAENRNSIKKRKRNLDDFVISNILVESPSVNIPEIKALTEPRSKRKLISRRSLQIEKIETVLECGDSTVESVDTSSFIYMEVDSVNQRKSLGRKSKTLVEPDLEDSDDKSNKNVKATPLSKRKRMLRGKEPKNDLSDVRGIRRLMKTPGRSPKNDLSNVKGVSRLLKTPGRAPKGPKNDLSDVTGIRKLMKTPGRVRKEPKNDLSDVRGLVKLMKTPKVQKEPSNDLTDVRGVRKLMRSSKIVQKEPLNDLRDPKGVKKLYATRKSLRAPKNDLSSPKGVKKLFNLRKMQNEPKNDLSSPKGVKKVFNLRKMQNEPKNDLSSPKGVKKLFNLQKAQNEPKNDLTSPRGVKQIMKTPKVQKEPKNDLTNPLGVKKLMRTPRNQSESTNDLSDVDGVSELFVTPQLVKSAKKTKKVGVQQIITELTEDSKPQRITRRNKKNEVETPDESKMQKVIRNKSLEIVEVLQKTTRRNKRDESETSEVEKPTRRNAKKIEVETDEVQKPTRRNAKKIEVEVAIPIEVEDAKPIKGKRTRKVVVQDEPQIEEEAIEPRRATRRNKKTEIEDEDKPFPQRTTRSNKKTEESTTPQKQTRRNKKIDIDSDESATPIKQAKRNKKTVIEDEPAIPQKTTRSNKKKQLEPSPTLQNDDKNDESEEEPTPRKTTRSNKKKQLEPSPTLQNDDKNDESEEEPTPRKTTKRTKKVVENGTSSEDTKKSTKRAREVEKEPSPAKRIRRGAAAKIDENREPEKKAAKGREKKVTFDAENQTPAKKGRPAKIVEESPVLRKSKRTRK